MMTLLPTIAFCRTEPRFATVSTFNPLAAKPEGQVNLQNHSLPISSS
jgi:hypothetical protein